MVFPTHASIVLQPFAHNVVASPIFERLVTLADNMTAPLSPSSTKAPPPTSWAATLSIMCMWPLIPLGSFSTVFALGCYNLYTRVALLCLFAWAYFDPAPKRGGRNCDALRRLGLWVCGREYFPSQLVQEAPLPKDGRYVFGVHPHGIAASALWLHVLPTGPGSFAQKNGYARVTRVSLGVC